MQQACDTSKRPRKTGAIPGEAGPNRPGGSRAYQAIEIGGETSTSFKSIAEFGPKLSAVPPQERRDIEAVPRFGIGVAVTGFGVGGVWGIVGLLLRMRAPPS